MSLRDSCNAGRRLGRDLDGEIQLRPGDLGDCGAGFESGVLCRLLAWAGRGLVVVLGVRASHLLVLGFE